MPAYNAESFIKKTIECVLRQTYQNIELVICNDSSSDSTVEIINSFSDPRIVLINNTCQSGSAYIPREKAFYNSKGEYVLFLDSDDLIEDTYIEKIYNRLITCDADLCCAKMLFVENTENGNKNCFTVPNDSFDFSVLMSGKEAFLNTVPQWKIGLNGLIAKREIWDKSFKRNYKPEKRRVHDDENFSRYMLLFSNVVAFCDVKYFYTMNTQSVTHVFNNRIFDSMYSQSDLLHLVKEDFGSDSDQFKAVERSDYYSYLHCFLCFITAIDSIKKEELTDYIHEYKKWHDRINWKEVRNCLKFKHYLRHRFFKIEFIHLLRKNKKYRQLFELLSKILSL